MVPLSGRYRPAFIFNKSLNRFKGLRVFPAYRLCFFDKPAKKQNSGEMKPFSRFRESIRKPAPGINPLTNERAAKAHDRGPS
jgi:hypothetical protein